MMSASSWTLSHNNLHKNNNPIHAFKTNFDSRINHSFTQTHKTHHDFWFGRRHHPLPYIICCSFTTFALKLFCQVITPKFSSLVIVFSNHIQIWHSNDIPSCLIYILWKDFLKVISSFSIRFDLAFQILV